MFDSERSIVFDWQNFWVSSIKFDYRTYSKFNQTTGVRLDSITERSIDYAWVQHNNIIVCTIDVPSLYTQGIKAWLLRSKACCKIWLIGNLLLRYLERTGWNFSCLSNGNLANLGVFSSLNICLWSHEMPLDQKFETNHINWWCVRLGNPDLAFQNPNPDFPIERTLNVESNGEGA